MMERAKDKPGRERSRAPAARTKASRPAAARDKSGRGKTAGGAKKSPPKAAPARRTKSAPVAKRPATAAKAKPLPKATKPAAKVRPAAPASKPAPPPAPAKHSAPARGTLPPKKGTPPPAARGRESKKPLPPAPARPPARPVPPRPVFQRPAPRPELKRIVPPAVETLLGIRPKRDIKITPLSKADVTFLEGRLHEEWRRLVQDLGKLESSVLKRTQRDSAGDVSAYSTHMADLGTDAMEREKDLYLASAEGKLVARIQEALQKVKDGTYGVCESCGGPIGRPRLEAVPHAAFCLNCQERIERS